MVGAAVLTADGKGVADGIHSFELYVAAHELPFVVLLQENRADDPDDRSIV